MPALDVRRRRALLGGVALAAAVTGAVVGASGDKKTSPAGAPSSTAAAAAATARRLPLDRAAGLLVMIRFRGTTAPAYVLRAVREDRAAGVTLFGENIRNRTQLRALTASLQKAAHGHALVAVDQEGGAVRRLPWAAPVESEPEQAAHGTVAAEATRGARDLAAVGINIVLAPVADVPDGPDSALAARGFSGDPAATASDVSTAVRAWQSVGVAPTLKHFPGLGAAHGNTDLEPVRIDSTTAQLGAVDLAPFRAGIAAGAPLIMVSHGLYPALDAAHIASQSSAIVTDLLRRQLGFTGVVVTDSLEARAVISRSSVGAAAVASVAAGADLALTTGRGSFLPVLQALRARARSDPVFATLVRESAARVIALRARLSSCASGRRPCSPGS